MSSGSVLVVGAGGFIGLGVAKAFVRAGYKVTGVVRREDQFAELLVEEVTPVKGEGSDVSGFLKHVEESTIIVWAAVDSSSPGADPVKTLSSLINAAKEHKDPLLPPKTFIYTSGIMVYGHDESVRDESSPLSHTEYTSQRRAIETHLLKTEGITPIIIRPGWVFGSHLGQHRRFFEPAAKKDEPIIIHANNPDRRYSWIHITDLGDAYVAAAQAGKAVSGEIFNIVGYDAPLYRDLVQKGAKLAGHSGAIKFEPLEPGYWGLLDASVVLSPAKAIRLLNWHPKIFGFEENLQKYYDAYVAYHKPKHH